MQDLKPLHDAILNGDAKTAKTTTEQALAAVAGHVVALAGAEDLPAHGTAVQVRFGTAR